ncbi:Zinc finger, C2H2 [Penicillium roqueforti FM164]|uniref:Zinc finger, C2H2 n=1 Tax=Penicillium roqueforti (strain FM164) TaxID=1365484 RepID=W6QMS7_PENRF|nr:Zinc finger, C2H2 [Penicillium roqueforti FM164]
MDAEEGAPSRRCVTQKCSTNDVDMPPAALLPKRQNPTLSDKSDDTFSKAISSACVKSPTERPTTCFICLGSPGLPQSDRLWMYKPSGSLSRHSIKKHIKLFPNDMHYECSFCGEKLESKSALLNHAERVHGTVIRSS